MNEYEMQFHKERNQTANTIAGSYNNKPLTRAHAVHAYQAVVYNLKKNGLDCMLGELYRKVKKEAIEIKNWYSLIKIIWEIYDDLCVDGQHPPDPFFEMTTEHI